MTDIQTIGRFIESPDWSDAEKWVIKWQFRLLGDFQTALAEAIARADDNNLRLIAFGFPNQVEGFLSWNRGDLADRLRSAGLAI